MSKFKTFKPKSDFYVIFLKEFQFIGKDDKSTMIKLFKDGSYIWTPNSLTKYQAKSKTGNLFNSISIKKDWKYKVYKDKQEIAELTGIEIFNKWREENQSVNK